MNALVRRVCGVTVCVASCAVLIAPTAVADSGAAASANEAMISEGSTGSQLHSFEGRGRLVAHAFVRAQGAVHGEVSILRAAESETVETLLYSRVLKRVVAEIALRESKAWPVGQPGAEESRAYIDALDRAQKKVWWLTANKPQSRDRVQEMAIDFTVGEESAKVALFAVRTRDGDDDRRRVVERDLLETLSVNRDYALRNQRLIVASTFEVDERQAAALLGRLVGK
jgi:hypothetical protein